jgi:hypothetical protein
VWVIIDSNSTDGTVEHFLNIKDSWIQFLSEKDNGIYDGLNKGLSLTKTKYYVVSGSDDLPNVDVLLDLILKNKLSEPDLILGNVIYENGIIKSPLIDLKYIKNSRLSFHSIGTIIKTDLHKKIGKYSNTLRLASDELFFQKIMEFDNFSYFLSEEIFGFYSNTGVSAKNKYLSTLEMFYVKYSTHKPNSYILFKTFIKLLYYK